MSEENATTAPPVDLIVGRLREWASGPAGLNPENSDYINLISAAADALDALKPPKGNAMTLIGREAWHASSVLCHGVIVAHIEDTNTVILLTDGGTRQALHCSSLLLTVFDVIREIDENIHYWNAKANEFEKLAAT